METPDPRHDLLTVVVAARDEAQALPLLHPRIRAVLDGLDGLRTRVLYVDDGSSDGTWEVLRGIAAGDPQVSLLRLSRKLGIGVAVEQPQALQPVLRKRCVESGELRAPESDEGQSQHQRVRQHAPGFTEVDAVSRHRQPVCSAAIEAYRSGRRVVAAECLSRCWASN